MKSSKVLYVLISFIVAFCFISPVQTEAAPSVGYVAIDSGSLNVRSAPSTKAKVIGSLKNNVSVSVYSQSKTGWSEIGYKGKRAYVASQYLRMYSFLPDKTKAYTYKADGELSTNVYVGKYNGWDEWMDVDSEESYLLYENQKGLYVGWPESEYYTDIAYPVKIGKKWTDAFDESLTYTITGSGNVLTTAAGRFSGVVTVKSSDGYISYYAKNHGFIKGTYKGKTTSELVKITKK
ncbi:SH3 domain-containing protein [Domibacillus enclensis]|uniref:SH3 domain-containing protein n=1 Tax=Domibacillus enclensis TaxID=1017273 RepID=A0A1N6RLK4_9BACI|nr:SH3 domain-containing protein [Domibacillus enclensis]SIQ29679.1 SH3 domain-containing protein [Domibacillus enclensis]